MSKTILIAGKNYPEAEDFAEKFALGEFTVALSTGSDTRKSSEDENQSAASGISLVNWNRDSAISARSLIIQTETLNGFTDNYILYFDASYFASKYENCSSEICARAMDNMLLGFQYLTLEILNRIRQHKSPCKMIFLLKSHPTFHEVLHSSALKKMNIRPANPLVASAEAAFATFAENIAAMEAENEYASIILISGDQTNETCKNDESLGLWLKDYIIALDQLKKGVPKSTSWVKAGAKAPGGFALFR